MSDELLGMPGKLNTLDGKVTTDRMNELDDVYDMLSAIAAALTPARIAKLDNLNALESTVGGANPTVQRGAFTIPAGATTVDVAIATIIPSKAYLPDTQTYSGVEASGYVVDANTLRFVRSNTTGSSIGRWELVYWS